MVLGFYSNAVLYIPVAMVMATTAIYVWYIIYFVYRVYIEDFFNVKKKKKKKLPRVFACFYSFNTHQRVQYSALPYYA